LLTCHFVFGNSENKRQRLEACVIMHIYAQYAQYAQYAKYVHKYTINYATKYATNMTKMQLHYQICRIFKLRNMQKMLHMQNMQ
jgi:hypothetical protein